MLQVDENIGGRQDQKNNSLRTKTLAVGLLMVVGCFVVGYFSATTTTAATTTAHTRVSQQMTIRSISNEDKPQCTADGVCPNTPDAEYACCNQTFTFDLSCLTVT